MTAGVGMTPRERFLMTFEHQEPDRVPIFDAPNNPALFRDNLGTDNYFSGGREAVLLSKTLGMDAALVPERGYTGLIAPQWNWTDRKGFTDELGVRYVCNESSWPLGIPVEESIADRQSWKNINLPDPREDWRTDEIARAADEAHRGKNDDLAVVAGIRSAFSILYISMGITNLSMAIYDDPDFVREMCESLCEFWTESALKSVERGADAVFIANDLGQNNSTIISPEDLRSVFFPSLAKQIRAIKASRAKIIFHSCGNIEAVLPDLVEMGIDGYNNLQVSAGMDIKRVKKQFGSELSLIGNVDSTNIMPSAGADEIEKAVKSVLRTAAPGGGHILATDHSFHKGIPVENVYAFIKAGKKWGTYPIDIPEEKPF
jgi:uroporphyrinogen decarboxylase